MTKYLFAFLLLCLLTPASSAFSQEDAEKSAVPIGTIAEIEGIVAMAKDDEAYVPDIGHEIFLGDKIETGPDSKLLIIFIDDTELTLGENAQLVVDEYVFNDKSSEENKGRFSVLRGAFIFVSGLISKNDNPDVSIETAYGSIGIRGTIVWGGTLDDEYNVFVQEGSVFFATDRGRVTVGPGQGTKARSRRSIPSRANVWQQDKIARAVLTVALKNQELVRQRVTDIKQKHAVMRGDHNEGRRKEQEQLREEMLQEDEQRRLNRIEKNIEYRAPIQKPKPKQEKPILSIEDELAEPSEEQEESNLSIQEELINHAEKEFEGDTPQDIERSEKMHLDKEAP